MSFSIAGALLIILPGISHSYARGRSAKSPVSPMLAAGCDDGRIYVWNTESGETVAEPLAPSDAEQHGYAIGARLHDVAVPVPTTYFPGSRTGRSVYTPPWQRPGWREVERQIRGGFAEGVIVLDRHNISSDDDEYHAVIKHLGERYKAFVHLVIPEEPTTPT